MKPLGDRGVRGLTGTPQPNSPAFLSSSIRSNHREVFKRGFLPGRGPRTLFLEACQRGSRSGASDLFHDVSSVGVAVTVSRVMPLTWLLRRCTQNILSTTRLPKASRSLALSCISNGPPVGVRIDEMRKLRKALNFKFKAPKNKHLNEPRERARTRGSFAYLI